MSRNLITACSLFDLVLGRLGRESFWTALLHRKALLGARQLSRLACGEVRRIASAGKLGPEEGSGGKVYNCGLLFWNSTSELFVIKIFKISTTAVVWSQFASLLHIALARGLRNVFDRGKKLLNV